MLALELKEEKYGRDVDGCDDGANDQQDEGQLNWMAQT
jgi:hypothetical protein